MLSLWFIQLSYFHSFYPFLLLFSIFLLFFYRDFEIILKPKIVGTKISKIPSACLINLPDTWVYYTVGVPLVEILIYRQTFEEIRLHTAYTGPTRDI